MAKIFVSIASYRDPELLPTLRDLISNAKHPENLVFSIAWQHSTEDAWDNLEEFKGDPRFKVIDIDFRESKGACWARHAIQQNYNNEEYYFQLDSHHRFVKDWDTECIKMIKQLKKGNDITRWLSNLFRKGSRRKSKMTVVRSSKPIPDAVYVEVAISKQEAIDKVLDKINKSGFDSLSKEEKEILYNASGKSNN